MLLGTVLLFVGAVLFINGMTLLGKIAPREAAVMNFLSGGICLLVSCYNLFISEIDRFTTIQAGSYGLLFAFTYLWAGTNNLTNADGKGLGWFSFFVAVTAVPITADTLMNATSMVDYWLVYCWAAWALLWFSFFLLGALGLKHLARPIAYMTVFQGVTTAWLPGYLILSGHISA